MQSNAKSQCIAEHISMCITAQYNALKCKILEYDDGVLSLTVDNTHIEVGVALLCPCTLTDPDSWQLSTSTPTSCPPHTLTPQGWKHFPLDTTLAVARFQPSAMQWIFFAPFPIDSEDRWKHVSLANWDGTTFCSSFLKTDSKYVMKFFFVDNQILL